MLRRALFPWVTPPPGAGAECLRGSESLLRGAGLVLASTVAQAFRSGQPCPKCRDGRPTPVLAPSATSWHGAREPARGRSGFLPSRGFPFTILHHRRLRNEGGLSLAELDPESSSDRDEDD